LKSDLSVCRITATSGGADDQPGDLVSMSHQRAGALIGLRALLRDRQTANEVRAV
jgi:hypothetical protein